MGGEPRASVRDRVEYGGFLLARAVLRALPERASDALGSGLGRLAGSVLRIRRGVVDENLARAFPELTPGERDALARASYRHLGRESVATFRSAGGGADDVLRRTEVHGLQALEEARAAGRGAIIVTGHLGNWEIGGASVAARGVPVDAVALRQRNRLFDRELVGSREALGMRVVPRGRAARQIPRSVADHRVPALVADQNARAAGVFVDFFGVPASTARGPALLSFRTGAALFLGVALRRTQGGRPLVPARYDVHLEEVAVERSGELDDDVRRLTAAWTAALERWVRKAPEQYFWVHKRWKTRPAVADAP